VTPISRDEHLREMQTFLRSALDYIDAIPAEIAGRLPAMPGFDRDAAEELLLPTSQAKKGPGDAAALDPATRPIPNSGQKSGNWASYDSTSGLGLHNDEFRPCILTGSGHSRRLAVIGDATYYRLEEFDIAEDVAR
jgi:hypothetical protein